MRILLISMVANFLFWWTKQIFFLVIKLEPLLLSWLQPRKSNCVPTELDVSISANEKKIEKDSDDFWHRKLTLKVKFWHFLTNLPLVQNSKFNNFLWFLGKNLSNLVSPAWKRNNLYYHKCAICKALLTSCAKIGFSWDGW